MLSRAFPASASSAASVASGETKKRSARRRRPRARATSFEKAGWLSRLFTYSWLSPLVAKARKGALAESDLALPSKLTAKRCTDRFQQEWSREAGKLKPADSPGADHVHGAGPSLPRALSRCFLREFIRAGAGLWKGLWSVLIVLAAFYFVREILVWAQAYEADKAAGRTPDVAKGWILAVCFFLDCWLLSVAMQQARARPLKLRFSQARVDFDPKPGRCADSSSCTGRAADPGQACPARFRAASYASSSAPGY
eukprot:tig00001253_g7805.t1